jgi:predicted 2-oxoglutarate/Fe(II)-dependent dioxygenase YbiX
VQPDIERHFSVRLSGCREPGFLVYGPGDFYRPHQDNSGGPGLAAVVAERRISMVVFLDSEAASGRPGSHRGGALTFYELIDEPRLTGRGIPLEGEAGLMVAFRSSVVHGVAPVTDGLRCTVVTWFFDGVMKAQA